MNEYLFHFYKENKPLFDRLKKDEGFRSMVYKDSEGYDTIGYGTLLEKGINKEEAELLLVYRMVKIAEELGRSKSVVYDISDNRYHALCNMAYNLGMARLRNFKKMWKAIEEDDWERAAKEALNSLWAQQVGARATRIADMLEEG